MFVSKILARSDSFSSRPSVLSFSHLGPSTSSFYQNENRDPTSSTAQDTSSFYTSDPSSSNIRNSINPLDPPTLMIPPQPSSAINFHHQAGHNQQGAHTPNIGQVDEGDGVVPSTPKILFTPSTSYTADPSSQVPQSQFIFAPSSSSTSTGESSMSSSFLSVPNPTNDPSTPTLSDSVIRVVSLVGGEESDFAQPIVTDQGLSSTSSNMFTIREQPIEPSSLSNAEGNDDSSEANTQAPATSGQRVRRLRRK